MKKLAIITTHPIQYNAPWFRLLADRGIIAIRVFYTWGTAVLQNKYDPGFDKTIEWDIPLLDGYDHCFVQNIAADPGSHHFNGIDNPILIKEIDQWNPDTLLVFGWSFKSHLKLLRHFKGSKKILFRGDSTLLDESPGISVKKVMRRVFLAWVYKHIDKALYVGTANQKYYLRHGVSNAQLIFGPHAIDNKRFMQPVPSQIREEAGIPPGAIVFLFTGKMEVKKDPQLLLDTFIRLSCTHAHLLLVGNGALEQTLKARAGRQPSSMSNRIHFLPFQNQGAMPAVYQAADVLVLPSQGPGETWGLSVNEAMACSLAVLVSDKCGCAADLVTNGENGYIFTNRDDNDLLQKMELLAKDRSKLIAMGKRSLQIIQSWNFEKICVAVEQCVL